MAQYTRNLPGAVGVKPMPAQSPKVLELSNQSDELLYNVDLVVKQKGIVDSSILQHEESKDANRDAQMSHAQSAVADQLE